MIKKRFQKEKFESANKGGSKAEMKVNKKPKVRFKNNLFALKSDLF